MTELILRKIETELKEQLDRCGILYRIFSRVKNSISINNKLSKKKDSYIKEKRKMQDFLAFRITLYFKDDVDIIYHYLKDKTNFISESKDSIHPDKFCPIRLNLVMGLPEDFIDDFNTDVRDKVPEHSDFIDNTYEIQIRTILSEGWHEVEHDFRYKCLEDWEKYSEYSRLLNGIYATLETSECSMKSLFDDVSYKHYLNKNWNQMLRNKMRIRFKNDKLTKDIIECFNNDTKLAKKIFKTDRSKILETIIKMGFKHPLTYDTIVHLINHIDLDIKNDKLFSLEDETLKNDIENLLKNIKL